MAARHEEPYDPYIPASSGGSTEYRGENGGPPKTEHIQSQIHDTVEQMKLNIKAVGERQDQLTVLNERADNLQTNSEYFKKGANRVRKQMFFKNVKMWIWILLGIAIIAIIVGVAVSQARK